MSQLGATELQVIGLLDIVGCVDVFVANTKVDGALGLGMNQVEGELVKVFQVVVVPPKSC